MRILSLWRAYVNSTINAPATMPPRIELPNPFMAIAYLILIAFAVSAIQGAGISYSDLSSGIPEMTRLLSEMFPPDLSRLHRIGELLLVTFQMAFAGTLIGVVVSFPLAALASRRTTPNAVVYQITRGVISLFRTIPDLVWALFFVATVGIGTFAGTLTLAVDTIGFCGRFFAEAMEETDTGPQEALHALGASKTGIFFSAIVPASLPSFVTTSLFSLEKAVRSSVVLGLVGAGGIGVELKVSMDLWRYSEACTIIICIFLLVLIVEQISSAIRKKILEN